MDSQNKLKFNHHNNSGNRNNNSNKQSFNRLSTDQVESSTSTTTGTKETYQISAEEYADFLRYQRYAKSNVKVINEDDNESPRATVKLDNVKVNFLVDTGTPINLIDEATQ